jgi:hypothetical protein
MKGVKIPDLSLDNKWEKVGLKERIRYKGKL